MEKPKWEQVTDDGLTWRLRIPDNGWLVRYSDDVVHDLPDKGMEGGWDWRSCMVFVPDKSKVWEI